MTKGNPATAPYQLEASNRPPPARSSSASASSPRRGVRPRLPHRPPVDQGEKRPGDEGDLLVHGSSERGANAFGWLSRKRSETWGYTAVAGAHAQAL